MSDTPNAPARIANPFGRTEVVAAPGASAAALMNREAADIYTAMMIARQFPRDPIKATDKILNAFTRQTLCEEGMYAYSKGGQDIKGLSIRAAEVLGQNWGNLRTGVQELTRSAGQSEFRAFAQDLETGFMDERFFFVRHWVDTRSGGRAASDEREIYEIGANLGARRKRACILTVIPVDIQELAERQIELTLTTKAQVTPEAIKGLLEAFATYGVTQELIEKRIQRRIEAMVPAQLVQMRRIFTSLKDGMSTPEMWFDVVPPAQAAGGGDAAEGAAATQTERLKEALRKGGAGKKADKHAPVDGYIPMYDGESAKAELKKCETLAALDKKWGEILKDFEESGRPLPMDLEPFYGDRKEALKL